jgi:hypothetical protein
MNRTVVGCGIAGCAIVIVCAVLAAVFGPRVLERGWKSTKQYAEKKMEESEQEQRQFNQILSNWFPPAPDIKGEDFFPTQIAAYRRSALNSNVEVSDIALARAGNHATYVQDQDSIDVFMFPASDEDWSKLQDQAGDKVKGLPNHSWVCAGTTCFLHRFSDGPDVQLLLNRGWIVIFRSPSLSTKKRFVQQFFVVTSKPNG